MTQDDLQAQQAELIEEIYAAFKDVSRVGGVSWSETQVIDDSGTEAECLAARAQDKDQSWTELIDDPTWTGHPSNGLFSFLDSIGFRYYLPAVMIREIRNDWDDNLAFDLTLPPNPSNPKHALRMGNHFFRCYSLLDDRQRRCVAQFIRYMAARDEAYSDVNSPWREAYNSYWHLVE